MSFPVAIAQATPAVLDLDGSVERACTWIGEAGRAGASLVAFPETWLPVYPFWCDGGRFSRWGDEASARLHARFSRECLALPSPELDRIRAAARAARVAVVIGANERSRTGTLYNALLFLDEQGALVGHRRKLVPTFGERLIWGYGDAAGLEAFPLAGARVGGLVCWEHWMPLARQVLHGAGEQIHVAAWPHGKEHHQLASRHYAFEGACFVLAAAMYLPASAVPADFELAEELGPIGATILDGGSSIIAPDGRYLIEPVFGREELLVAELDLDEIPRRKLVLDTAGHYARPDLFRLEVRTEPLPPER